MKNFLWIVLIGALNLLAYWFVSGPWRPEHQFVALLVAAYFFGGGAGGLWMMYMAVRYESRHWHLVALACIPFTFLWYYVERLRTGRYNTRALGMDDRRVGG
jgi:hypothetical protein